MKFEEKAERLDVDVVLQEGASVQAWISLACVNSIVS